MNFKKETVKINSLFLDPNNPRFADISDDALNISIKRFTEEENCEKDREDESGKICAEVIRRLTLYAWY